MESCLQCRICSGISIHERLATELKRRRKNMMSEQLTTIVNGLELDQLFYKGMPVVTYEQIALVHGISIANVHKTFQRHREEFLEGEDYIHLDFAEAKQSGLRVQVSPNGLTLFTEHGYMLLVKPMRDKVSWQVQRLMRNAYFREKQQATLPPSRREAIAQFSDLQAIVSLAESVAETRIELQEVKSHIQRTDQEAAQAKLEVAQVKQEAAQANAKSDLAIDLHSMTIEEFILKNGLINKCPPSSYARAAAWLTRFCNYYAMPIHKVPVEGKTWTTEKRNPLQAIGRWLDYEMKKPKQPNLEIIYNPESSA